MLIAIPILIVSFPLCHSHLIGGLCVPPCDCFWRRSRTDFPETHVGGAPRNSCGRTTLRDGRRQAFFARSATQLHQRQRVHRHGESPHLSMIQQHGEQSACALINPPSSDGRERLMIRPHSPQSAFIVGVGESEG
jgi:hypothetical protein